MNNIEQLKLIILNAPDGATHYCNHFGEYLKFDDQYDYWFWELNQWSWANENNFYPETRALSDIKTIVEQAEEIERLKQELSK